MSGSFGHELQLDFKSCENIPCNRAFLVTFFEELCNLIDMEREDLHFWDYEGDPKGYAEAPDHLKGISAVQFISTSSITIHTIDVPQCVFINIFSCKTFDVEKVRFFCANYFDGFSTKTLMTERG